MDILAGLLLVVLGIVFVLQATNVISPYERGLLESWGKYIKTLNQGIHFVIPLISKIIKVDMRERVINTPQHEMITKDNAVVTVDAVVYAQIIDPYKAVYEITDPFNAVVQIALANLRAQIGNLTLDECLSERQRINAYVQTHLSEETAKWGIKVNKVEIQNIEPPSELVRAMQEQKKAEQEKRAQILRAEGQKQASIMEAEGFKQAEILRAEGEKQKNILQAEGEAQAIERLAMAKAKALELEATAAMTYFKDNAVLKEQLKVLEESLKNNSKYVLDSDIFKLVKTFIQK